MTNNTEEFDRCASCANRMTDARYIVTVETPSTIMRFHKGCAYADGFIDDAEGHY